MNIVDSSGWLEYFADTPQSKNFAKAIEKIRYLIVPAIILYEVFKKILIEKGEDSALKIVAHMKQGRVIDLDMEIALRAARLSKDHKLPMADSIILATAQIHRATIWTQDSDFKGIKGVNYFSKR